jgi:23S rRNA (guanine745-N1)-methyltransferase
VLSDVVERLACPHCGSALELEGRELGCERGHGFDVARQGYVSLLPGSGQAASGDSADMVAARQHFLDAGHYDALLGAVAAEVVRTGERGPVECVLDVGAGTGHYLAAGLDAAPGAVGIAVDASKPAARRAAGAHPRIGSVLADVWQQLPVRDGTVDVALTVFAPRGPSELRRVLSPHGALVVLTPTPRHLGELVDTLGLLRVDERKPERLADAMAGTFVRARHGVVEQTMQLGHADVAALVGMGPSAWHLSTAARADRVASLPEVVAVTVSVQVSVYHPTP